MPWSPDGLFRRRSFHDYCLGGQLTLFAARHWMLAYRRGRTVPPCVWQSYCAAGLSDAYARLCELLTIVAFREFPAGAFARPDTRRVTETEHRFMEILHAVEQGDQAAATRLLSDIASPAVARAIVASSAAMIRELALNGHRIANLQASESLTAPGPALATAH
jgi:hypothetical protein